MCPPPGLPSRAGLKYLTLTGWLQLYRRTKPQGRAQQMRLQEAVAEPAPKDRSLHLSRDVLTRLARMTNHQVPEVTPEAWPKVQTPMHNKLHHSKRHA